jgi:solute carrier family 34 (sodium-dependent phosphate cotransporter)
VVDGEAAASGSRRVLQPPEATGARLSTTQQVLRWLFAVAMIYLLICGVRVISAGFRAIGSEAAANLFNFAHNPGIGLAVRVLATVP